MALRAGRRTNIYKVMAKTKNMSRQEWFRLRKNGIGGSDAADSFINKHFAKSQKGLSDLISQLDTEKKKIEQEIKAYMNEVEYVENENFFVSWKNSVSNRIDTKRLKAEMPEVYKRFVNPVRSRKFIVKAV